MPIHMEVPAQFLQAIIDGRLASYGCVVKNVASGRIVGHLKEVGLETLCQSGGALRHLHLIGSVGAAASVIGLGVSVAGFGLVLRRLDRLEHNLNQAVGRLRAEVEQVHLKLDMLQMAELRTAWEQLAGARRSVDMARTADLLWAADKVFQKHRHYYFELISELRPLEQVRLELPHARELLGRFLACGQAELEANFLLNDLEHWRYRHEMIVRQVQEVCDLDARKVLHARVDALGLVPGTWLQELRQQVEVTRDFCQESKARVETASAEVEWLEQNRTSPEAYLLEVEQAPDEGVVLVRHRGTP